MTSSELLPKNEDVCLAYSFIEDKIRRADVLALYAFLEALRDVPERVTDPLLGEIRLRWWFEAVEDIQSGRSPRYHPLTAALERLVGQYGLDTKVLCDLIEGQMPLLEKGALTIKQALGIVDRGEGNFVRLASTILTGAPVDLTEAMRLWGMARLKSTRGLSDAGEAEFAHLLREARLQVKGLSSDLFPLVLPGVLTYGLWHGQSYGPLEKRLRLLWAYAIGRL